MWWTILTIAVVAGVAVALLWRPVASRLRRRRVEVDPREAHEIRARAQAEMERGRAQLARDMRHTAHPPLGGGY